MILVWTLAENQWYWEQKLIKITGQQQRQNGSRGRVRELLADERKSEEGKLKGSTRGPPMLLTAPLNVMRWLSWSEGRLGVKSQATES